MSEDTTYIADCAKGWGKGNYETEALHNLLRNNDDFEGDVEITIIRVRGDWEFTFHGIRADEIVSTETLIMPAKELNRIADTLGRLEIAIEELLVESPTKEDDDE